MKFKHQQILDLYKSGFSMSEIAKDVACSTSTVHRILHQHNKSLSVSDGLKLARNKGKITKHNVIGELLLSNKEQLKEEYRQLGVQGLSRKYHLDNKRVHQALHTFNLYGLRRIEATTQQRKNEANAKYPKLFDQQWLASAYKEHTVVEMASELQCSTTAVRSALARYNIAIETCRSWKHKRTSRGVVVEYNSIKGGVTKFRSLMECSFALLLDNNPYVSSWLYEDTRVPYIDSFTGKQHYYVTDFEVSYIDGHAEFIEVKPLTLQQPHTKYLYAQNNLPHQWRFITNQEIQQADVLFRNGFNSNAINFKQHWPKCQWFIAWSKSPIVQIDGWQPIWTKKYGSYYRCKFKNNNQITIENHVSSINKRHNAAKLLDLTKIIELSKTNKAGSVAKSFGVSVRGINAFLRRRSYHIIWAGVSNQYNKIFYAGQQIWPAGDNTILWWDTKDWLYDKYINQHLGLKKIAKLAKAAVRTVRAALIKHNLMH